MIGYIDRIKIFISKQKFTADRLQFFFKANYAIFPALWTLTFFIGVLESFTYAGYSFKHLFLPFQLLMGLSIFSGIVTRLTPGILEYERKNQTPNTIIITINKLIFAPLLVSYFLVNLLELQNYPNYVFSTIHLQPSLYFWPIFLSSFLLFISIQISNGTLLVVKLFLTNEKEFVSKSTTLNKISKDIFLKIVVFVFVLNILMNNIKGITGWMYERSKFIVMSPTASYDEKMRYGWGNFYDYMLFVRNNTPETATIMFPPMINPWMDVGGGGLIRYFLYPRNIIQDMTNAYTDMDSEADYAMLTWGSGTCTLEEGDCHGWPRVKVSAESIIYKKDKSTETEKSRYNVIYDYNDEINKGAWGLIKIKKN